VGSFTVTWGELLIVIVLALAVYVGELMLFLRSSKKSSPVATGDGGLESLHSQLASISAEVDSLRQRIDSLQAEISQLRKMQQTSGQYREAVEMAHEGRDAQAVAEDCGISRGEAELIVALHRASNAAAEPVNDETGTTGRRDKT
jgi:TolA-binding protein